MLANTSKTVYQYSNLWQQSENFYLLPNNENISKSNPTKYLSMILDNKLNWTEQISNMVEKVEKFLNIII